MSITALNSRSAQAWLVLQISLLFSSCSLVWGQDLGPVPRADTRAAYEQLSRDLVKHYSGVLCNHNVHVILALDTSGSMQDSRTLERFYEIWSSMLYHFFQPGDRFTLIPFNDRVLSASNPQPQDYYITPSSESPPGGGNRALHIGKRANVTRLMRYFRDPSYLQKADIKGTAVYQAQAAALRAGKIAERDPDRVVLVLVVGDQETTNPVSADQRRQEDEAKTEIPTLMKNRFVTELGNNDTATVMGGWSYTIGPRSNLKLFVFHALGANYGSKRVVPQSRKVYVVRTPVEQPHPDKSDLGWLKPLAFILFLLALPSLLLARSHVIVSTSQKRREFTLPVFNKIIVFSQSAAGREMPNELMVPLHQGSDKREILNISCISPFACMIRKTEGRYMCNNNGTEVSELVVPYDKKTDFKAGLDQQNSENFSIHPAHWWKGKTWQLASFSVLIIACIICWAIAASQPETPYVTPTPVGYVVELCTNQPAN